MFKMRPVSSQEGIRKTEGGLIAMWMKNIGKKKKNTQFFLHLKKIVLTWEKCLREETI